MWTLRGERLGCIPTDRPTRHEAFRHPRSPQRPHLHVNKRGERGPGEGPGVCPLGPV